MAVHVGMDKNKKGGRMGVHVGMDKNKRGGRMGVHVGMLACAHAFVCARVRRWLVGGWVGMVCLGEAVRDSSDGWFRGLGGS